MSNFGSAPIVPLGQWARFLSSVAGETSAVVDSVPVSDLRGATYIITFWNDVEGVVKTVHLDLSVRNGAVNHTVSTKLGDSLDVSANPSLSGSDMVLTVANNEAFSLEVELNRLVLGT